MIRNYELLVARGFILDFLVSVGVFTSFYAGVSSLAQPDLKKVVALSTLSHLGFICFALGAGWANLASFHLLAHALFKSSLFIGLGVFISSDLHYQDSRYLTSLRSNSVLASSVMFISVFNLIGLPFLSGFFSKDIILEALSYRTLGVVIQLIVYFNLLTTFSYSFRIIYSLVRKKSGVVYNMVSYPSQLTIFYSFGIFFLSALSIIFGVFWTGIIIHCTFLLPVAVKILPSILLILRVVLLMLQKITFWPSSPFLFLKVPFSASVSIFYL